MNQCGACDALTWHRLCDRCEELRWSGAEESWGVAQVLLYRRLGPIEQVKG